MVDYRREYIANRFQVKVIHLMCVHLCDRLHTRGGGQVINGQNMHTDTKLLLFRLTKSKKKRRLS